MVAFFGMLSVAISSQLQAIYEFIMKTAECHLAHSVWDLGTKLYVCRKWISSHCQLLLGVSRSMKHADTSLTLPHLLSLYTMLMQCNTCSKLYCSLCCSLQCFYLDQFSATKHTTNWAGCRLQCKVRCTFSGSLFIALANHVSLSVNHNIYCYTEVI